MAHTSDANRQQLEGLIVMGLKELKGLETGLDRQFSELPGASPQERKRFLGELLYLEKRARRLEELIDALEEGSPAGAAELSSRWKN
jgi:hypothetical protein